jgi:hypothetical protein
LRNKFGNFVSYVKRDMKATLQSVLLVCAFVFATSIPGWASVLNGTSVNGYLVMSGSGSSENWYDPSSPGNVAAFANFGVHWITAPDLNVSGPTVVISATVREFGWCACAAEHTSVNADFTDTGLKVTSYSDTSLQFGWVQTFTDAAFAGLSIANILDTFNNSGVSAAMVGDVLTLTWLGPPGPPLSAGPFEADFSFSSTAATPLPAALPLFATGLGAFGLLGWRRKRKNAAALAAA